MATDGNGLNLCRNLRNSAVIAGTPLIFLIEASGAGARVLALESGGDDCIVKPFSPAELVARVQAILRRLEQGPALPIPIDRADLVIDSSAMRLSVRGIEVATTSLEFCLIEYLARHRGKVFTRDLLLDAVWGDMQFVTPRSVDACVRRIREKIEPDRTRPTYLKTVRGVGYRLDAVTAWPVNSTGPCSCIACRTPAASSRLLQTRSTRRRRISA
jgi:DNA-binding response OmpR family regulator